MVFILCEILKGIKFIRIGQEFILLCQHLFVGTKVLGDQLLIPVPTRSQLFFIGNTNRLALREASFAVYIF